jgi:hypothetical protein
MNTEHILSVAKLYSTHTGRRLSTIGVYGVNDGKFFGRLETGNTCTIKTAEKMMQWLSDAFPTDLAWPADIPRPMQSLEKAEC